jgi:hypothetical protein
MKYEKEEYFKGNLAKAIEMAKNTFLPNGFEIIDSSDSYLEAVNRSSLWGYKRHPLNGVSMVSISGGDGRIILKAELGGVTKMVKYLIFFIAAMIIFFLVLFGLLFGIRQGQPISKVVMISLLPFAPWLIAIPLMKFWFKKRAGIALDTLIKNMINASR